MTFIIKEMLTFQQEVDEDKDVTCIQSTDPDGFWCPWTPELETGQHLNGRAPRTDNSFHVIWCYFEILETEVFPSTVEAKNNETLGSWSLIYTDFLGVQSKQEKHLLPWLKNKTNKQPPQLKQTASARLENRK